MKSTTIVCSDDNAPGAVEGAAVGVAPTVRPTRFPTVDLTELAGLSSNDALKGDLVRAW